MVKLLIIEGGAERKNGNLRAGFYQLLAKEVPETDLPRIIMGNSQKESIKKIHNSPSGKSLLVDLDHPSDYQNTFLNKMNLTNDKAVVFFMIQEMEAWFISQPNVLKSYYPDIDFTQFGDKNPKDIIKPSLELETITRYSKSRKYHKIKHAVELLPLLDTDKLKQDFSDFKQLVTALKN